MFAIEFHTQIRDGVIEIPAKQREELLAQINVVITDEAVQTDASQLRERYSFSHWDSLIISAALLAGTSILYSEDMQDGLVVNGQLTIVNPFQR